MDIIGLYLFLGFCLIMLFLPVTLDTYWSRIRKAFGLAERKQYDRYKDREKFTEKYGREWLWS